MKPILVGTAITFFVSLGFAIAARWLHPYVETRSFLLGEGYLFLSLGVTVLSGQLYYLLRKHGWTAKFSDWGSRISVGVTHDWHSDEHGCFFFDVARVFFGRSHETGTFQAELFLLGFGMKVGILIDRTEYEAHEARRKSRRDELSEKMRQDIVNMIKSVVPAEVLVGTMPNDDDSSVH